MKSGRLRALDFDVNATWEIKSHKRVNRLICRLKNIDEPVVGPKLKMLHGLLVDVRTSDDAEPANIRRQRCRASHASSCALCGIGDLLGRLVDDPMIVCAEPDSNFDSCHSVLFIKKPPSLWTEAYLVS